MISCCNCDDPRFDKDGNKIETELYCWDSIEEETLTGDVSLQILGSYNRLKVNEQKRLVKFIRGLNGTYMEEKRHKGDSLLLRFSNIEDEESKKENPMDKNMARSFKDVQLLSKIAGQNIKRRAEKRAFNKRMGIKRAPLPSGKRSLGGESDEGKSALARQLAMRNTNDSDWGIIRKEITLVEFCRKEMVDYDQCLSLNLDFFEKKGWNYNDTEAKLQRGWRLKLPKPVFDMFSHSSLEADEYVHVEDDPTFDVSMVSKPESFALVPTRGGSDSISVGDTTSSEKVEELRPTTKERLEGTKEKPFTPGGTYRPFSSGGTFRPLPDGSGGEVIETFLLTAEAVELAKVLKFDVANDEIRGVDLDIVASVSKVACQKEQWRFLPPYEKLVLLYPPMMRRYRERARKGDHQARVTEAQEEVAKYYDVGWATTWGQCKRIVWLKNWSATRKFEWFEYQIKSRTIGCNRTYHTKYFQRELLSKKTKQVIREAGSNNGIELEIIWDAGIKGQRYIEGGGVSWQKNFYQQGYKVLVDRLEKPTRKKDITMKEKAEAGKKKFIRRMKKIQRRCEIKQMKHMRRMLMVMIRAEQSMHGWVQMTETDEMLRNRFMKPDTPGYQVRVPPFEPLPEELIKWKDKEFRVREGYLELVRKLEPHEMTPDIEIEIVVKEVESNPFVEENDEKENQLDGIAESIEEIDSDIEEDELDMENTDSRKGPDLEKFEQLRQSWADKRVGKEKEIPEDVVEKQEEFSAALTVAIEEDVDTIEQPPILHRSLVSELTGESAASGNMVESATLDAEPSQLTVESWERPWEKDHRFQKNET